MLRDTFFMTKRPTKSLTSATLALVAFVAATSAVRPAQAKLGDGLELGTGGRLKLGLDLNGRYDNSIVGKGDAIGKVEGKFQLNVKNESLFVDFGGGLGWNQYAGLAKNKPSDFSFFGAHAKGEIAINRDRPVGFTITELFSRSDQSSNPIFGLGVIALQNHTKARLAFRPGGGAIDIGVSGAFDAGVYNAQVDAGAVCSADPTACASKISLFNSTTEMGYLDASWRLLPKTGLLFELGGGAQQYASSKVDNQLNVPATPLIATIGFGTLITTRLSFSLKAGYQGILFANGVAAHHDLAGQVEISYHFTDAIFARVGATRASTPVGSNQHYFTDNRIYLDGSIKVLPVLKFDATVTTDIIRFGGLEQRGDTSFGLNVGGDWSATDWLHVVAGVLFSTRSSQVVQPEGVTTPVTAPAGFSRVVANVGIATMF